MRKSWKRSLSAEHLPENDAETEDVHLLVVWAAEGQLWGHVFPGAYNGSAIRVRNASTFWNTGYTSKIKELQLVSHGETDYGGADIFILYSILSSKISRT